MKKILTVLIMLFIFSSWANAAVVNWASIKWWNVTWENTLVTGEHNLKDWETLQNEDCLKYPEKCNADIEIPSVDTNLPDLKSAWTHRKITSTSRLPRTWPEDVLLILISLFCAGLLFFVLKDKRVKK